MIGQNSPTDPLAEYAQRLADQEARIAELERAQSSPPTSLTVDGHPVLVSNEADLRMLWTSATSASTDGSGDVTITATGLSSITGAFGAQRNTTVDHRTTVHTLSGNTFKMRVRDGSGAVVPNTVVFYTAWAVGPPA